MSYVLGFNGKAYFSTTLLDGANTDAVLAAATELTNLRDVTLNLSKGQADVTTRATSGWEARAGVLKDGTVDFQMLWDTADEGFEAIKNAWLATEAIPPIPTGEVALFFLDQDRNVSGAQGLAANFSVLDFSRSEALREAFMADVSVSVSTFPEWYEVP